ncbi:MAG TPA: GFA family protein [Wenzhouxiangella sp.]|nr:GFA family protein [Wenzhouxiangella sp.]
MHLEGSCHCQRVRFSVESPHPCPFNYCYCSICRKTAGGSGCAINLGALAETLQVEGREHVRIYRAEIDGESSPGQRNFCGHCASVLWVFDPRWPDLIHPFASAIDTDLPKPPERNHLMLGSKANWVEVPEGRDEHHFEQYPNESLAQWHERLGLSR